MNDQAYCKILPPDSKVGSQNILLELEFEVEVFPYGYWDLFKIAKKVSLAYAQYTLFLSVIKSIILHVKKVHYYCKNLDNVR